MRRRTLLTLASLTAAAACRSRSTLTPEYPLSRTQEEPFRAVIPDEIARPSWAPPIVEQFALSNAMPVYFVPRPASGVLAITYVNRRISTRDARIRRGVSDLLSALLSRGTTTHPGARHAGAVDAIGAQHSIRTTATAMYASITTSPTAMREAIGLLAESIVQPELDASEFAIVQRQQGAYRRATSRGAHSHKHALTSLFGAQHPFALAAGGAESELSSLTLDDVRRLYRERMIPQHSAVAIAGDVSREEIESVLQASFGRWVVEGSTPVERAPAAADPRDQRRPWQLLDTESMTTNASVTVVWPMVSLMDPSFADALVLAQALGGGATGLFDRSLRERANVTYGVDVRTSIALDGGYGMATTVVATHDAPTTAQSMQEEIDRLRDERVSRDAIRSIRLRLRNQFLSQFETVSGMSDVLSSLYAFELGPESWTRHLELLDAVTPRSLQAAARRLLSPDRLSVTIVGNRRAIEAHLRMLAPMGCVVSTFEE